MGLIPVPPPTLKPVRLQVWPLLPVIVPPPLYVGLFVLELKFGLIPAAVATTFRLPDP